MDGLDEQAISWLIIGLIVFNIFMFFYLRSLAAELQHIRRFLMTKIFEDDNV